jgi:iron complex transport system substrate-binding protein
MIRPSLASLHLGLIAGLGVAALATFALADTPKPRVVSLGGSVTETIVALGAEDLLVGRDSTSNYPESVLALPDVGYIRALSPEGVLSLTPDLILSEDGAGPVEAVAVLQAGGIPFVTMPGSFSAQGVLDKITSVAAALNLEAEGAALADKTAVGFAAAAARADAVTAPQSVLFVISLQGGRVMAGGEGSSAAGIIALAGGVNAVSGFDGYKQITDEAVIAAAPDVILMMDRGGDLALLADDVLATPALAATPAAKAGRIIRMDGMLLLGFGPRTPDAALALNAALYGG